MKKIVIVITLMSLTLVSCSQNERTARIGGTQTITLQKGEKLEYITWKTQGSSVPSLWYLTTKRDLSEAPKTHIFKENSAYGLVEGTVIIVEQ